jgi:hypothetical protein
MATLVPLAAIDIIDNTKCASGTESWETQFVLVYRWQWQWSRVIHHNPETASKEATEEETREWRYPETGKAEETGFYQRSAHRRASDTRSTDDSESRKSTNRCNGRRRSAGGGRTGFPRQTRGIPN